jgi:hypothetical protein
VTLADDLRAWTRNQIRTRRAYNAREAQLSSPTNCPECGAKRDGHHSLCWRCRHAYKETR